MEDNKDLQTNEPGIVTRAVDGVWGFFKSIKLTVILLIILALVSIVGTIVDQTDPNKNIPMMNYLFGPENAPGALDWFIRLGLTNMYHSWWFVLLLTLLSANITICTIDRFPRVWKNMRTEQGPLTDKTLKAMPLKRELKMKGSPAELKARAAAAIKAAGYTAKEAADGADIHLFSEKGRYSRLGVYITHASVIIIFVGALMGSFWGFKGYVQILEGQTVDSVGIINKPLLRDFGNEYKLGFEVRCDKFELHYYGRSAMPKDYISDLTVLDGGQEVMKKTIQVNDPLQHNGIRFFQSSYGMMPSLAKMTFRARPVDGRGQVIEFAMGKGEKMALGGTGYTMVLAEMAPDVVMGPNRQLRAQSDQFKGSAAAIMEFFDKDGNEVDHTVILNMDPRSQPQNVPYIFEIFNYKGPYYTGLQVTYDPGVWIVWLGCTLMVFGILVAFFTYHKRVWVRLSPSEKGTTVTVAGGSNKNQHVFEKEFKRLVEKLEA